ncbi:MAG: roadblock/LC7 domain-containing protein [Calditrichia bacterium]|nr:roadblock/LC7 domain-containing protein [Calditrichota bacterium]MCB0268576.1 roadblock/LC7 domain-containing protein [Calditrichota bacterium]MCB0288182.1 roadblock/LC7 domain-containing protein [Calditrichota bacterium]
MSQTTSQKLQAILKNFQSSTPDIEGVAVASDDGLVIASRLPEDVEEDRVGAMSAAILSLGERSSEELNRGDVKQVLVKGENGYVVLMNVGSESVLITMTTENVKLGLLFLELKRAAEELRKAL